MNDILTVGELISVLQSVDPDLPVMTLANNHHTREVHSVTLVEHWGEDRVLIGNQSQYNNNESVKFKCDIHIPDWSTSTNVKG